jgi:hypothetical protein
LLLVPFDFGMDGGYMARGCSLGDGGVLRKTDRRWIAAYCVGCQLADGWRKVVRPVFGHGRMK